MASLQKRESHSWTLEQLHAHLQDLIDLEFWTIPFYASALYSIRNRSCPAYRLIQAVVHEEMMHAQFAGNIANAYGLEPVFSVPVYEGDRIPHLDFALDTPNPTQVFTPFTAEIGPCDRKRVNAMCLIEYPNGIRAGGPSFGVTIPITGQSASSTPRCASA